MHVRVNYISVTIEGIIVFGINDFYVLAEEAISIKIRIQRGKLNSEDVQEERMVIDINSEVKILLIVEDNILNRLEILTALWGKMLVIIYLKVH